MAFLKSFGLVLVVVGGMLAPQAQAQGIGGFLKNTLKDAGMKLGQEKLEEVTGIQMPCMGATANTDFLTYCLQNSLSSAVAGDFAGLISGDDLKQQELTALGTIFSGEAKDWVNEQTGASGSAKVVKEKTKTKKTKITLSTDRVETVPPLVLIGENYTSTSTANVRSGPGTDYKVVGSLDKNAVVNVVGQVKEANWYLISEGGVASGYVFADLLNSSATAEATATATTTPDGQLSETKIPADKTCKTIEQVVKSATGKSKTKKLKACQGPNGWVIS